ALQRSVAAAPSPAVSKELRDRLARTEADLASLRTAYVRSQMLPVIPPPSVPYGRYHALVIGIGEYRNFPQLSTAVRDAEDVAGMLRSQYGFVVRPLLSNARGDEIKSELVTLRERLKVDDNLLIYYSGRCELDRD